MPSEPLRRIAATFLFLLTLKSFVLCLFYRLLIFSGQCTACSVVTATTFDAILTLWWEWITFLIPLMEDHVVFWHSDVFSLHQLQLFCSTSPRHVSLLP